MLGRSKNGRKKFISRVFEERENLEKALKKKSSSTSVQPPRSLAHQSPLDALPSPRSQENYRRPPGQSFWKDSSNQKQSFYKHHQASSSKGHFQPKGRKTSLSPTTALEVADKAQPKSIDHKGSQQSHPFNCSKKGTGGGGSQQN